MSASGYEKLENDAVNFGGIDLTHVEAPVVKQSEMNLPDGDYALYIAVFGNVKKVSDFSVGTSSVQGHINLASKMKVSPVGSSIIICAQYARDFVVMDMMGKVLKRGNLVNGMANVQMDHQGGFIVRAGTQTQRVNLK